MKKWISILAACIAIAFGNKAAAQYSGIGINIPVLMTGTVNAAIETAIAPNWTTEIALYWNPIKSERVQMQLLAIQPAVRYWLYEEYAGHFLAAHAAIAKYDVGGRRFRRKGSLAGIGLSYGHAWPISQRWNLTLEAGVGFYYMNERKSNHTVPDDKDETITRTQRIVFAPSKVSAAFYYLF